jgi:hypothetical protein
MFTKRKGRKKCELYGRVEIEIEEQGRRILDTKYDKSEREILCVQSSKLGGDWSSSCVPQSKEKRRQGS